MTSSKNRTHTRVIAPVEVGLEGLALRQSNADVILHYNDTYFGIRIEHKDWYVTVDKDLITWNISDKNQAHFVLVSCIGTGYIIKI